MYGDINMAKNLLGISHARNIVKKKPRKWGSTQRHLDQIKFPSSQNIAREPDFFPLLKLVHWNLAGAQTHIATDQFPVN